MNKQKKLVFGLVVILLVVIFALLNTKSAAINFGFTQINVPLILLIVLMLLIGAGVTYFLARGEHNKVDQKAVQQQVEAQMKRLKTEQAQKVNALNEEIKQLQQKNSKLVKQNMPPKDPQKQD